MGDQRPRRGLIRGGAVVPLREVADHLASAPMLRATRALIVSIGLGAGALAAAASPAVASPPTPPPVDTTPAAAATTSPGTGVPPTTVAVVVPPPGTRGGAVDGSVAKPRPETWSPRRIATMTGLAVVALAAAGYAYGKLRSAPPRHPDLVRRPPDLDGVDHADVTG